MQDALIIQLGSGLQSISGIPPVCTEINVSCLILFHTIPTFNNHEIEGSTKRYGKRRKCWLPALPPFPTKIKYENKQGAIIQKLSKQELQIMCTAHPLDEIYPPTKFQNHS